MCVCVCVCVCVTCSLFKGTVNYYMHVHMCMIYVCFILRVMFCTSHKRRNKEVCYSKNKVDFVFLVGTKFIYFESTITLVFISISKATFWGGGGGGGGGSIKGEIFLGCWN